MTFDWKNAVCVQMRDSAKFTLLTELLPQLRDRGSRPLIFSQWTAVMDLLEWLLQVCACVNCWPVAKPVLQDVRFKMCIPLVFMISLAYLTIQDLEMTYVRLDGSTAVAERLAIVDS